MTAEPDEKTQILLNQRIKFKSLKGKRIRSDSHARPKILGSGNHADPNNLGLEVMLDLNALSVAVMLNQMTLV
jgi:hypothetical protein